MNKFYKRLLITFVSITFGYSFIFFGVFLYSINNHGNEMLNKKNEVFISQMKNNIDTKFIMAKNVVTFLQHSEFLKSYGKSKDINYYAAFKLNNTLTQSQASFSELGYIISILKKDTDMVITPYGTRDLKSFMLENGLPLSYKKQIIESFNSNKHLPVLEGFLEKKLETSDNPFLGKSITFTEQINDNGIDFIFFLTFYEESLLQKNMLNTDEALILYEGKRILMNKTSLDSYLVKSLFENRDNNKDFKIYESKSSVIPDGGFIFISKNKSWESITRNEIIFSIPIYCLLIVISIIVSIAFTKGSYKPINKILYSLDWEGNVKDEFKFIQDTTKKIQEANEILSKNIMQEKIPLQVKFLRDCLNGLLGKEEINRNLTKYNLVITAKKITAVVIHFNDDEKLMNNFSNETIVQIREKVSFIIKEHLKLKCTFELVDISYLSSAVIIFDLEQVILREIFTKILKKLSSNEELDITISIGNTVNNIIDIKRSYFSAISELDKWEGMNKQLLPVLNDDRENKSVSFFYPLDTERRIIKYMSTGKDESISLIQSVLDRNKDSLHLDKAEWDSFISAMVRTIKRVLTQINKPESLIIHGNLAIKDFINDDSRNLIVSNIVTLYKKLLKSIQETSEGEQKSFADKLLKYIKENYSDPNLSLTDIADYFNLSPAYISRIFKDYTGRNFKDLLSLERINISKSILEHNPKIKVYALGNEVGFNSTNTFLRTFKKYTGISPGKYASNIREKE